MCFWKTVFSLLICGSFIGCPKIETLEVPNLERVEVYPIESNMGVELSGLTWFQGKLYAVADKHDYYLFRIEIEEGLARLEIEQRFNPPSRGQMDWEGITHDLNGTFYLASEGMGRIAKLEQGSSDANWISESFYEKNKSSGLFARTNAGLEGIVWLSENKWLLAAEREPRGFVEYHPSMPRDKVTAYKNDITQYGHELSIFRLPDYSGLTFAEGVPWVLFRNAHLLVRLEYTSNGYRESEEAYSYRFVENDPDFLFLENKYGQAEGVAYDGEFFYIVLDNNLSARKSNPKDRRPLLFKMRIPN